MLQELALPAIGTETVVVTAALASVYFGTVTRVGNTAIFHTALAVAVCRALAVALACAVTKTTTLNTFRTLRRHRERIHPQVQHFDQTVHFQSPVRQL